MCDWAAPRGHGPRPVGLAWPLAGVVRSWQPACVGLALKIEISWGCDHHMG